MCCVADSEMSKGRTNCLEKESEKEKKIVCASEARIVLTKIRHVREQGNTKACGRSADSGVMLKFRNFLEGGV